MFSRCKFRKAVASIPDEYWNMTEKELLKQFTPASIDLKLKARFNELLNSRKELKAIKSSQLYEGICTFTNFYNHFLPNPLGVVHLLKNNSLSSNMEHEKMKLLSKLGEIMELEVIKKNGRANSKNIELVCLAVSIMYDIVDIKKY